MARKVEWQQIQTCGACGVGTFRLRGVIVGCTECDHEHDMDTRHLDTEVEEFTWEDGQLAVVCFEAISEED